MSAGLVKVNGTRLFVDDRGPHDGPTLLYLYGGPGLGCHDFMAPQGDAWAGLHGRAPFSTLHPPLWLTSSTPPADPAVIASS